MFRKKKDNQFFLEKKRKREKNPALNPSAYIFVPAEPNWLPSTQMADEENIDFLLQSINKMN